MKQFLLTNFPDTTQLRLSEEKGTIVEKQGDGIIVKKCHKVGQHEILYERRVSKQHLNHTITQCYEDIPVKVQEEGKPIKIAFIDLATRTLKS